MAESKEVLKSLMISMKEESEKAGLKLIIQKMKITVSGPITSRQIEGGKVKTMTDFIFLGSKFLHTMTVRSDQISHSVVSDSLRPHELQHARPPCPSPTPGVH